MMMLALVVGAAVSTTACSSDAGGRDVALDTVVETLVPVPPTTAEATTLPLPLPTEPATTSSPEPTSPPTDPPTTEAETTTTVQSKEDVVRADFESGRAARHQCAYTPETCAFEDIAVSGSPMDVRTRAQMAMRIQYNLRAVNGKGDELVRIENVGFEGESAFVTICDFDTVEIYDIVDPSDPADDILYNGDIASTRVRWEMRLVDGRWLLFQGTELERLTGGDLCAF